MVAFLDGGRKSLTDDAAVMISKIKARCEETGYSPKGPIGLWGSHGTKGMRTDEPQGERHIVTTATTDEQDLEDEVVLPFGADVSYFDANKSIFADHRYDSMNAIGIMRNMRKWTGPNGVSGWQVRLCIPESKTNPLSEHVWVMAKAGKFGCSIGFEALDYGRPTPSEQKSWPGAKSIIRTWKWLELSSTFFPCNVSAAGRVVTVDEGKDAEARALCIKSAPSEAVRRAFRLYTPPLPMLEIPAPMLEVN